MLLQVTVLFHRYFYVKVSDHDGGSCNAYINKPFQVEFSGGALRCGEYVTLRKVGDASQKVRKAIKLQNRSLILNFIL